MSEVNDQILETQGRFDRAMSYAYDLGTRAVDYVHDHTREGFAVAASFGALAAPAIVSAQEAGPQNDENAVAQQVAATRSNDTLDKYDLIAPEDAKFPEIAKSADLAIGCLQKLATGQFTVKYKQRGLVVEDSQTPKKGSNTVNVKFKMADYQYIASGTGFSASCAWFLKEQSVRTQLVKKSKTTGNYKAIDQTLPAGVGKQKKTKTFYSDLSLPGYSGSTYDLPKPEQKTQVFKTDKPVGSKDKYAIKYTIKASVTPEIKEQQGLTSKQKKALKPLKVSVVKPVKIKK